jgi:polygalacturonase
MKAESSLFSSGIFILLPLILFVAPSELIAQQAKATGSGLAEIPFSMPEIELPLFPEKTFYINDYGAKGDGQTLNTEAFSSAIKACHESGGGTIIVPPGIWLTGPIQFMSNVNLHVKKGAIILFSRNHEDYPIIQNPVNKSFIVSSPIFGFSLENIAITGEGIIDGSGETWRPVKKIKTTASQWKNLIASGGVVSDHGMMYWPTRQAMEGEEYLKKLKKDKKLLTEKDLEPARDFMRPYMVMFYQCKKVLFDGPTFQNSPKFVLYPTFCEDVTIRNLKVFNEWWAQNGDGIDLSGGKNILIHNCLVSVGDDAICMKSSKSKNYQEEPALQNVVITDCVVYHGHGGFVIGSNTDGGMKNIYVNNCTFMATDIGLRFKSSRGRGGLVENIYISNIYMKDIVNEAILFNTYYEATKDDSKVTFEVSEKTPRFQKFFINNIYCNGAKQAINISGLPEMPVQDINFENVTISSAAGFESKEAQNIRMSNINIMPGKGPIFAIDNSRDFSLKNITCPEPTGLFMKLQGKLTSNIQVLESDLSSVKKAFELGDEVRADAVIRQ